MQDIKDYINLDNNLGQIKDECDRKVKIENNECVQCFFCKRYFEDWFYKYEKLRGTNGDCCSSIAKHDKFKNEWTIYCGHGSSMDNITFTFYKPKYFNDTRKKYLFCDSCVVQMYKDKIIYLTINDCFVGIHEYNNSTKNGTFSSFDKIFTYKNDVLIKIEKRNRKIMYG